MAPVSKLTCGSLRQAESAAHLVGGDVLRLSGAFTGPPVLDGGAVFGILQLPCRSVPFQSLKPEEVGHMNDRRSAELVARYRQFTSQGVFAAVLQLQRACCDGRLNLGGLPIRETRP
jgi:hypothetical protein